MANRRRVSGRGWPGTAGALWQGRCGPGGVGVLGRVEDMLAEYELLGLCPEGHIMELLRPEVGAEVVPSKALPACAEAELVKVTGRVVRRQRTLAKAVFLTLVDDWRLTPVVIWEQK